MSPRQDAMLTKGHQWLTVTAIPALLSIILYFLVKIDKKIDVASDAVIRHEQRIDEHDRRINHMEQYVFKSY